jgi:hypothetical protein
MPRSMLLFIVSLILLLPMKASAQSVAVEVLSAEETHWTTTRTVPGSDGDSETNCSTTDANIHCNTTTSAGTPGYSTPVYHMQVDIVVKMPDGNTVKMQCHYPPVWASCFKPDLGAYPAKIDGRAIHLLYRTQGKPEYNKDGTIKKPGKIREDWIKFSFE